MSRWKASFIHLLISLLIVSTVAAYIIYFWYPLPLMHMSKADKLLAMVAGIDLIIGPLLTLLVYKQGKKTLKMDLTVIAALQAIFLSMGLYTMYESRPVFLVASSKMFDLVFATDITPERLAKAPNSFKTLTIARPTLVGVKMPTEFVEKMNIISSALAGNGDLQTMPQYYVDYQQMVPEILTNALPLIKSKTLSANALVILIKAAEDYGYKPEDVLYMHLGSSRGSAVMLVGAKTGEVIGPVNLDI